jgi:hypothetical protein
MNTNGMFICKNADEHTSMLRPVQVKGLPADGPTNLERTEKHQPQNTVYYIFASLIHIVVVAITVR